MKRAQELRVDECSIQKLRESHDTIQRLTSQIQELQERVLTDTPHTSFFSCTLHFMILRISHCMAQDEPRLKCLHARVTHIHAIHNERLSVCSSLLRLFLSLSFSVCLSITLLFSSHFYLYSDLNSFFHVSNAKAIIPRASANRGVLPSGRIHPSTEMIFQEESGDKDTEPSYLCDTELEDETIGKALSSPLFTQEREEPADRRQACHSYEESFLPAQSFFHTLKIEETCARS